MVFREGIPITNAEKTKDGFINFYLSRLDKKFTKKQIWKINI